VVALVAAVGWLALALGCAAPDPATFVGAPSVRDNPAAGLTAWLDATLTAPAALEVELGGPERTVTLGSPAAVQHSVLLLGLHPGTRHDVVVRAVDAEGQILAEAATSWTAPSLPAWLSWEAGPVGSVEPGGADRREPGVTLVAFGRLLAAIDPEGHAVWTLEVPGAIHEASWTSSGTLRVLSGRTALTEYDLAGRIVSEWAAARTEDVPEGAVAVDVEALHHDLTDLPDGSMVALSVERRWIEDYPSSEVDPAAPPAPAWVAGDVVVEIARSGEVTSRWPLLDRLDPLRIGYDAVVGNFWEDFASWDGDDVKDWSHGNAVSYDPGSDTVLAGLRHQDAVVGLSRATGEVRWILAPRANWPDDLLPLVLAPEDADAVLPYHMHGAKFTPAGTVMLFDNGNDRASAYEPRLDPTQNFSRALEVAIDVEAGTWREVWSYGEELVPSHYSGSLGDADLLPVTGNVLITFGNLAAPDLGGVRLLEVTRAGEIVWELVVPHPDATMYRSQRIAGMIPGL
jgi:arylsulfate sulfotransferase